MGFGLITKSDTGHTFFPPRSLESFTKTHPEPQYGACLSGYTFGSAQGIRRGGVTSGTPAALDTARSTELRSSNRHTGRDNGSCSHNNHHPSHSGGGAQFALRPGAHGRSVPSLPQLRPDPDLLQAQFAHPSDCPDSVPVPVVLLRVPPLLHIKLHERESLLWHVRSLFGHL